MSKQITDEMINQFIDENWNVNVTEEDLDLLEKIKEDDELKKEFIEEAEKWIEEAWLKFDVKLWSNDDYLNVKNTFKKWKEKKLDGKELIKLFNEARENNDMIKQDYYFQQIYNQTKGAVKYYISMWFNNTYPWYDDELDSEFQFQLLRRISDYWDIQLEWEWKKRWQKLWNNGKNEERKWNFNLQSLAIAITKSIHMKLIHKFNDKITSLDDIKKSYKNQEEIKSLSTFSDIEQKINRWWTEEVMFEIEDTDESNKYHFWINETISEIREYFNLNPKRLITLFKKDLRKDKWLIPEEQLNNILYGLQFWIVDNKIVKIIEEFQKRDTRRYEKVKNLLMSC